MIASAESFNAPVITESPRRLVLYQHHVVGEADLPVTVPRAFGELYQLIEQSGVEPVGPPFTVYQSEFVPGQPLELDVCAPVATAMAPSAHFSFREMPATRVVSLLHIGPYDTLGTAYECADAYIRDKGLIVTGPPREFYLSPPETPPEQIQTIVEWPVA